MVVVGVDDGDVDRPPAQRAGGFKPAEPGADDHDARPRGRSAALRSMAVPGWVCVVIGAAALGTTAGASFDHLVGAGDERCGDGDPKHPGGLLVEDKIELARLNDRQV